LVQWLFYQNISFLKKIERFYVQLTKNYRFTYKINLTYFYFIQFKLLIFKKKHMSFNILEAAKGLFNNDLIGAASSFLGESQGSTQKAVDGIIPAVVGNLINKSATTEGASGLLSMLKNGGHDGGILSNLGGMFGDGGSMLSKGASLVSSLFGDKTSAITNVISQFAGIKGSSAGSLMSMAAPAVLGLLGKHVMGNGIGASGLSSLLGEQKGLLSKFMPAGLGSLLSGAGLGNATEHVKAATTHATSHVTETAKATYNRAEETVEASTGGGMKWLLPLLGALIAAGAIWWFAGKGCKSGDTTAVTTDTTTAVVAPVSNDSIVAPVAAAATAVTGAVDSLTGEFTYDEGAKMDMELPNGAGKINVGANSTEARLINFLNSSTPVDTAKGNWYEFTNVKFKTGSSEITEASLVQLKNMVAIAKAYPTAQFKIGGYTDNVGKAASNVALSQKRAYAVAAKLTSLGAAAASLAGAKGYGPEWPIGDNSTAAGRAQNRRVAVNVKAK
jgi:OmpA-OmpF porin, OOP family